MGVEARWRAPWLAWVWPSPYRLAAGVTTPRCRASTHSKLVVVMVNVSQRQTSNVTQHAANHHSLVENGEARQCQLLTNTVTAPATATATAPTPRRKPFTYFRPIALSLYMFASRLPAGPHHHVFPTPPTSIPHDAQSSTIAEHVAWRTPWTHGQHV